MLVFDRTLFDVIAELEISRSGKSLTVVTEVGLGVILRTQIMSMHMLPVVPGFGETSAALGTLLGHRYGRCRFFLFTNIIF